MPYPNLLNEFWTRFFPPSFDEERDLEDMSGKVVFITGGSYGIGYETARYLVRRGAKVYIASRDESRAVGSIKALELELELEGDTGGRKGSLHWVRLDLGDVKDVKKVGEEWMKNLKEERLDVLVNNAAMGAVGPYKMTNDGILNVMAINHVGHFVLTSTLLPLLKQTAAADPDSDVRIINISSLAHTRIKPSFRFTSLEDLNTDFGNSISGYLDTYGLSKLANILHISQLQSRLSTTTANITCLSLHPGGVFTPGATSFIHNLPLGSLVAWTLAPLFFVPERKGARTVAIAAAGRKVREEKERYKGGYLVPYGKMGECSESGRSKERAEELWEVTERVVRELGV